MTFIKNRILFRADGNSKIGLGHIMRCIALSQMLRGDFHCSFIISHPSESLKTIIAPFGELIELKSMDMDGELLEIESFVCKADIMVVDGYAFDEKYIGYLNAKVHKLVIIDDFAVGYFDSAIVLNHANESLIYSYKTSRNTKVLCGFNYLMLRPEFLKAARTNRSVCQVDTVFVCMGGADPTNVTIKVLEGCIKTKFIKEIIVVTGSAYANQQELASFIKKAGTDIKIVNHINVDANTMVKLISSSQICICPASSIALEVCCVKAALLTGTTANNQKLIHEQLLNASCANSVGDFNHVNVDEISIKLQKFASVSLVNQMIKNQFHNIDGQSADRILDEFKLLVAC
ncbi:MAG: UDP-2,4-diacetamido-2,4,6-trideoxy-beta-L-altropyranose hydrolase [Pedobacter sp.]|uniref:UDP-2,4-diacetamido-2,4, 6-trideoxy-beta-L-altropyranose hydrolase n=1 Tax=Pedobacter sp. TaxID=1411316 RepID=UPI00356B0CCF